MLRLPTQFTYYRPTTVEEAVKIAADHGPDSMYVAGGTDLYPNMKRRQQQPKHVISLSAIGVLRERSGDAKSGYTLGAMTTLAEIEHDAALAETHRAVVDAATSISTPLLRNMGTIGGNLLLDTRCNYYDQNYEWRESINFCMKCDGDTCWVAPSSPRCWAVQSSDSVPVLTAMGAEVTLVGPEGERRIPASDLYHDDGIQFTNKKRGEILTKVHLPATNGWRASYRKLRRRDSFDFPVLGIGACLWFDGDTVTRAEIRIGGAGSYAIPATKTVEMITGQKLTKGNAATDELLRAASQEAFKPTRAMDNTDHEASWRKKMAPIFVRRAIEDCL
ncbi:MAG: FAD binding domain-containing protein [Planctomycetes bacterium]|nr:FAD binding domain-containing protein [Planctomycetota bacterium]